MQYLPEKQIAIKAVTQAAQLCLAVQRDLVKVESLEKDDRSPVTIADFGAQALVCHYLTANLPQAVIVGEEDSADLQKPENRQKLAQVLGYVRQLYPEATEASVCAWIDAGNGQVRERFWTLDPIDGTKGFLRDDQYAVALALIEAGQVQVAALACPTLAWELDDPNSERGVVFVAVRGQGATMARLGSADFTPIRVVDAADKSRLRFVESVEAGHSNHQLQQAIAQAVGITQASLRMDSQTKYGAVARGDAGLYLRLPSPKSPDYREKIWDHAAGSLIVEEAGGQVSDMHGQPLDFASDYKMHQNRGVIVSSGTIHAAVLAEIERLM